MNNLNDVTIPFQHPFMLTVCGPSQSGKTYWIYNLLLHLDKMIDPPIMKIVYLYTSYQPLYDKMKKVIKEKKNISIEFIICEKDIPRAEDIQTNLSDNTLVILDDLMTIASSSKENTINLDNYASRDSHHSNISIIFTCQNLCYGNGKLRNTRVNSQYTLLFKNIGDRRNMNMIADNKGVKRSVFNCVLNDVEKSRYGYLLFDNCANSYENARVRTNVFPHEKTVIYDI